MTTIALEVTSSCCCHIAFKLEVVTPLSYLVMVSSTLGTNGDQCTLSLRASLHTKALPFQLVGFPAIARDLLQPSQLSTRFSGRLFSLSLSR